MYTLAGTFSLPGEMSSKTDGSTFVGLWVKSKNSMLILIKLTFHFSFFCRLPFLPEMELGSHDLEVFDRSFHQIQLIPSNPTFN